MINFLASRKGEPEIGRKKDEAAVQQQSTPIPGSKPAETPAMPAEKVFINSISKYTLPSISIQTDILQLLFV